MVRTWEAHTAAVIALQRASEHANLLASGSKDHACKIWDIEASTAINTIRGHQGAVRSISFSSDDKLVFTAGDSTIRIWDRGSNKQVGCLLPHQGHVTSVQVRDKYIGSTKYGMHVLTSSLDCSSKVWDLRSRVPIRACLGHAAGVTSSCFSPDVRHVASVSLDSTCMMFDVAHAGENEPPFTYELPCGVAKHLRSLKLSRSPLNRCGISKCGQILATASQGGVVGLTKLGPDLTTHFPAHDDQQVRDLCWSDDGKELVSCGGTKLLLWDLRDLVDAQSSEASSPGAQTDQTVQDLLGKTKPFGGGGISSKRGGNSGDLLYCCEIIGQSLLGGSEDGSIMLWHRGESVNDLDP